MRTSARNQACDTCDDAIEQGFQVLGVGRVDPMKTQPFALRRVDPVAHDHVQVHIQVQRRTGIKDPGLRLLEGICETHELE